jgi:cytosine/uracil/thiamine/allantoin permease
MKQPDTLISKYLFLALVGFLVFFIFSIMMWILSLSGKCSISAPKEEEKKKKKNNKIIYLLIFVLVCSMAAQAVNQSYTRIVK